MGLIPPFSRDALNDHLLLPSLWQDYGFFWRSHAISFTAYPPLADIPYLLFTKSSWDWIASVWHALGSLGTILLLNKCMSNLGGTPDSRMWALLTWSTMPVVIALTTWCYVDLWLCFTASALAELLSRPCWRRRDAVMFGFLMGLGMLIKYSGLPLAIGAVIALIWRWRNEHNAVWGYFWLSISTLTIVAAWWYAWNYYHFGNLLYPLGSQTAEISWFAYRQFAYGESSWWAALSPLRQFFWGETGNPQLFDGMLHPLLLLAIPSIWLLRKSPAYSAIAMMGFIYMIFALTSGIRARYFLPGVLFWIPLIPPILERIDIQKKALVLIISFSAPLYSTFLYFDKIAPWDFWVHGREYYLNRHIPDYEILKWASDNLDQHAAVYLLWMGGRAYYLDKAFLVDTMNEGQRLRGALNGHLPTTFTHVLMRRDLAERTIGMDMKTQWANFLDDSQMLAKKGNYELWRVPSYFNSSGDLNVQR